MRKTRAGKNKNRIEFVLSIIFVLTFLAMFLIVNGAEQELIPFNRYLLYLGINFVIMIVSGIASGLISNKH